MKQITQNTNIAFLLLIMVCVLNIQFYFEYNTNVIGEVDHTVLKQNRQALSINPFIDLIEDQDETETKASLLHSPFVYTFITTIFLPITSSSELNDGHQCNFILAANFLRYVRYCTFLI